MPHIVPPYLYKYKSLSRETDVARTIEIIKTGRIYTSPLNKLNDPMEGRAVVPGSGSVGVSSSRATGKLPEHFFYDLEICRILSLSETPTSPQMWAYYADGYKGVCLQMGLLPFDVEPMRYTLRPYRVDGVMVDSKDGTNIAKARLLTKHKDWSHELEWRGIFTRDYTREYVSLGSGNPSAVILGHECHKLGEGVTTRIKAACKERNIPLYETYIADWEFSVKLVPFGFKPKYSGEPLESQVLKECRKRGLPIPLQW